MDHETTMPARLTQPAQLGEDPPARAGNVRALLLFGFALLLLAVLIYSF